MDVETTYSYRYWGEWYQKDAPVRPLDGNWVLVVDKRTQEPMKAKYHSDNEYFEYDTDLPDVYGSYIDDDEFIAWTPMPMFYGKGAVTCLKHR